MENTIVEYFFKPIAEITLDRLTSYLSSKYKKKVTLKSKDLDIIEAYRSHLNYVDIWSSEIVFNYTNKPKNLHTIYVALKFYVNPVYTHFYKEEPENIEITDLVARTEGNIVILGHPGAGKSTSIKHICQDIMLNEESSITSKVPILIKFRDLTDKNTPSIFQEILNIFSLDLVFNLTEDDAIKEAEIKSNIVINFLNGLDCILLLDGFDEISTTEKRNNLLKEIKFLSENLDIQKCKFVLTSRTGEFRYSLTNTSQFQLAPLSEDQIKVFISKWLVNDHKANDLWNQIQVSPFYDATVRPLTIAHLCAIYEKYEKIPDQPKSVYELIVNLLLKDWNEQWSVKRNTSFSEFEIPRKFDFLSQLAFLLTTKYQANSFSTYTLLECYKIISPNFSFPLDQAQDIVHELESHTGLFIQSGYDKFEFPHKSIQEYLSARYLNSIPLTTQENTLQSIPNELAIATSISINPTIYLYSIVFEVFRNKKISLEFFIAFLNRLLIERPRFTLSPILSLSILFVIKEFIKLAYEVPHSKDTTSVKDVIAKCEDYFSQLLTDKIVIESFIALKGYYQTTGFVKLKYGLIDEFIEFKKIKDFDDNMNHYTVPYKLEIPKWITKYSP